MANHPHNSKRPESKAVAKAVENNDIPALKLALSPRQLAFCHEYVVDFNGSAAVIRAGYSRNHSDRQAYQLLQNKGVRLMIEHLSLSKEAAITAIDPDYVISKVTEIIGKEGTKDGDRLRGLELLARHLGMFIDRQEITGKDGGAIEVEQRRVEQEAQEFKSLISRLSDRNKKEVELI
jgi:phage terminase small subunit